MNNNLNKHLTRHLQGLLSNEQIREILKHEWTNQGDFDQVEDYTKFENLPRVITYFFRYPGEFSERLLLKHETIPRCGFVAAECGNWVIGSGFFGSWVVEGQKESVTAPIYDQQKTQVVLLHDYSYYESDQESTSLWSLLVYIPDLSS